MLLRRAERWDASQTLARLAPEYLEDLQRREGCDFATTVLHQRIVQSAEHGPFLRELGEPSSRPPENVRVVIVPGAFYRENPRTGADGGLPRGVAEGLGLPVTVAPMESTGTLSTNARILADFLPELGQGQPIIMVSVSKGGSDVKAALARPDATETFRSVRGWINLCGLLDGTPMADWLLSSSMLARANRFAYRVRGRSLDFLDALRWGEGCALDFPLTLPPHLRAIHVLGFPLRHHLRNGLAQRCHRRLERYGPNDGSILLTGALRWPGQLCPVWGADHYLRPRLDVRPLLAALLARLAG